MVDQRRSWSGRFAAVLAAAALLIAAPATNAPAEPPPAGPDVQAVLAKLDTLAIKGRAPKTGYDRELFGQTWSDDVTVPDGHNGCDTRNDILRRALADIEIKPEIGRAHV